MAALVRCSSSLDAADAMATETEDERGAATPDKKEEGRRRRQWR